MGRLIVVGAGMKSVSHITLEARRVINGADHCLFLVTERTLKQWIEEESKSSESLESIYFNSSKRINAYIAITEYIVKELNKYNSLCVVFYGHPSFFASSALWAVQRVKETGGEAIILPGISSADTLYADLCIDPGDVGCSIFEATDFLVHRRLFDPRCHLVLFQIGMIGGHSHNLIKKNIKVLIDYLLKYYSKEHKIILYEASVLPAMKPIIRKLALQELYKETLNKVTTLYVEPLTSTSVDYEMISKLGIEPSEFLPS